MLNVPFCSSSAHLTCCFFLQCPRITLNKITLAFFVFSVIHCFAQGILHSLLYSVDRHNDDTVMSIIHEANVPQREIPWLTGNSREFKLQLCTSIPTGMANNSCTTVFDSRQGNVSIPIPDGFRRSVCCYTSLSLAHCSSVKTG
jgi:hypothetical protein